MLRTHTCGELRGKDDKSEVKLCGWVTNPKNHGGLIFSYLRDRHGMTQLVFNTDNSDLFKNASNLRREDVIQITGKVNKRPDNMINKDLETGEVEIEVSNLEILNKSEQLPIELDEKINTSEEMRLKYRYLDLRKPNVQKKFEMRHNAAQGAREFLNENGFLEVETPLLIRATPEGARDYIVPSRTNPGKFFSLPQSPQLYKQILMVAGFDRYYQLAKCLRDEDLRADRQPEFTQIDFEMSFADEEDIMAMSEGVLTKIFKKALGKDVKTPFDRMKFAEAMERFGSDKPDLRYGLELTDVTDIAKKTDFNVLKQAAMVKIINPEKDFSRKEIDKYTEFVKKNGAKGLAYVKITEDGKFDAGISKFLPEDIQKEILKATGAKTGTLMFIADKPTVVYEVMDRLRRKLADDLDLYDKKEFKFCWITHFPLFEYDEERDGWKPMHHIFSMPHKEFVGKMGKDPAAVTGQLYDCTLNGVELGGGSIRIHRRDIQEEALKVIGMDIKEAERRFGFLLEAFKYGAPPHGGLAFGFDRVCALLNGTSDIREVIAFPKNKNAECPMDGCPSTVDVDQLAEANIKIDLPKQEKKHNSN